MKSIEIEPDAASLFNKDLVVHEVRTSKEGDSK